MSLTASVVIASWGRPALLRRACLSVYQQDHRPLELVVVADAEGLAAVAGLPFGDRIKTAPQRSAGLATARNEGVALASGEVCAFLDDDAAAEPTWLRRHVAAIAGGEDAATGPTLGRNGITRQWGAAAVTGTLGDRALPDDGAPGAGEALKLIGTNMAVRRGVLAALGGFDPAFRYYLDDTDLSLRLALAGHKARFVPDARVHHASAANATRGADRTPRDLTDLGMSAAHFLAKHGGAGAAEALQRFEAQQIARIDRSRLDPAVAAAAAASLRAGLRHRAEAERVAIGRGPGFLPLREDAPRRPTTFHGRWPAFRNRTAAAAAIAAAGHPAYALILGHTMRAHRLRFTEGGFWLQTGGLFGRADRSGPR
ncbi:MAG: glycosyltransferase, partial [Pseudomonadota bacterium]